MGRYEASVTSADGGVRFLLRRSGGPFAARFLLRSCARPGDDTGVENAKGGIVVVDLLKRIVAGMVSDGKKNNEASVRDAIFFDRWIMAIETPWGERSFF